MVGKLPAIRDVFYVVFPSGQLWTAACGGGTQRGDGAGQVSFVFLAFQHYAHIWENVSKRQQEKADIARPFQFGFIGRAGRHWLERYSSPVQEGGKKEVNGWKLLFVFFCRMCWATKSDLYCVTENAAALLPVWRNALHLARQERSLLSC